MTYACSDIHGNYVKYKKMLDGLALKEEDELYIIGDVLDRGPDGVKILQDMMQRPEVIPILGNHELNAALVMPWLIEEVTDARLDSMTQDQIGCLNDWIMNGGAPTLRGFKEAAIEERSEILEYIRDMDVYAEVFAGGKNFLLTHSGIRGYSPTKPLDLYDVVDFVFGRPDMAEEIAPKEEGNIYRVFGHTPTRVIRKQTGQPETDDVFISGNKIAIDCACAYGGKLGALCLDTLETIYF